MLRSELLELIANGENSHLEFKRDDVRPEQLAKEVVALVNHRGGHILLGVDDDGTIVGLQRDDAERWVMDTVFARYVRPWILPSYQEVDFGDGRRVGVVRVTQGPAKPYVVRHQDREEMYIRLGSTSRRATREQQARLFASGGLLHTESLPVSGSGLEDLSRARLENYLSRLLLDHRLPEGDDGWEERLCGLGFMTRVEGMRPACSIAGLVVFGLRPRRLLRQAGIRWMAFAGTDKSYDALDDFTLDAPLVALWSGQPGSSDLLEPGLFELFMDRVRPFISQEPGTANEGLRRDRIWHYPIEALREAVVNALAHRDWTRANEVEVVRYADRLEVTSPGALQNAMTVEKMVAGQRSARNSIIVDILRDYGYVDARGMGVRRKIIPLIREASGVEPRFAATEDHLTVVLPRGRKTGA
ncbi:MAG: putative DNA binding domain-containing protein [Gemmatimonadetes bacterium]|nr:putative DNA binding domain-containing protein [Gemmatimonadota bacterium]